LHIVTLKNPQHPQALRHLQIYTTPPPTYNPPTAPGSPFRLKAGTEIIKHHRQIRDWLFSEHGTSVPYIKRAAKGREGI
jgi:hypothetical protein